METLQPQFDHLCTASSLVFSRHNTMCTEDITWYIYQLELLLLSRPTTDNFLRVGSPCTYKALCRSFVTTELVYL